MPALEVDRLTISYGPVRAVDRLSFTGEFGEVLALLGPNGAGKTSTVEALEGYRRPTDGAVRVLGLDPVADHARLTPQIGVMLQSGGVYPGIRALEALELFAGFYADPDDPAELLERLGLSHVRAAAWRQLSGGEQQRLSMALALVGRPRVAFLDEPTNSVDVQGRQLIRRLVRELAHDGVCVVLTTHDLDEAEKVADRVVILDRGRLLTSGTPGELMSAGGSREIRFGAEAGLDTATLGKAMMAAVEEVSPGEYRIEVEPSPANIAALTNWLAERDLHLADLRAGRQRLEDVFLRMTQITGEVPSVRVEPRPAARPGRSRRRPGAA
jgi:ABC-2 type transport system ATP-binding protein